MLAATLLALTAAVMHAGWNLAVKQSGDRYLALWGQFSIAGAIGLVIVVAAGGIPAEGWVWAAMSGIVHVPYCWFLARAYDHGDFSLVYPMARGGGAHKRRARLPRFDPETSFAAVNAGITLRTQGPAPFACRPEESRGRRTAEPESRSRTAFQRDRDRIIHSTAFRRLEYKTQVFVNHEGDYYRTRLTHTIEVAQIARALTRAIICR